MPVEYNLLIPTVSSDKAEENIREKFTLIAKSQLYVWFIYHVFYRNKLRVSGGGLIFLYKINVPQKYWKFKSTRRAVLMVCVSYLCWFWFVLGLFSISCILVPFKSLQDEMSSFDDQFVQLSLMDTHTYP